MIPGLVSITFRKLSPQEIIAACLQTGLRCIEWGGDVHVPHGNLNAAEKVGAMTRDAGLSVAAYGSYYRLATDDGLDFSNIVETAAELGAPVIRVWAGTLGSAQCSASQKAAVAADALHCADLAGARNIRIAYEFHGGTLTDTAQSAMELLEATAHPFIKTLWQPSHGLSLDECLSGLKLLMPRLEHVHVFHWCGEPAARFPLADGWERWSAYVAELRRNEKNCPLTLEFVKEDALASLQADAQTLRTLCTQSEG
jgi:sugar phosphate isomerase/epimerase